MDLKYPSQSSCPCVHQECVCRSARVHLILDLEPDDEERRKSLPRHASESMRGFLYCTLIAASFTPQRFLFFFLLAEVRKVCEETRHCE